MIGLSSATQSLAGLAISPFVPWSISLFGMRRADLAPSGIYAAIGRTNIETGGVRLEVTPSARLDGFVHANLFWLDSATDSFSTTGVRDASGRSGRYGGEQLEGRLRYWLVPRALRFETNAVFLHKGHFLKAAPNAPATAATSAYVSAAVTASF